MTRHLFSLDSCLVLFMISHLLAVFGSPGETLISDEGRLHRQTQRQIVVNILNLFPEKETVFFHIDKFFFLMA